MGLGRENTGVELKMRKMVIKAPLNLIDGILVK